ncbi:hypothetical protein SDC9_129627 [bioreactor metagenome]|uniref:Uncharacterized protein n=1 Tax=bioreactor metagenome TaxID=1076179 RepID=A0A645CZH9_9ZZZZ
MSEAVDFSTMSSKDLLGYFQGKAYSDSYNAHENDSLFAGHLQLHLQNSARLWI